jgi:hypothetical protein
VIFDSQASLSPRATAAVKAGLRSGITSDAITAFVRWFQLETWLRQLVHLEMSAAHGRSWTAHLENKLLNRASRNTANAYMLSPDEESLLAYGDVADLFSLIEDNWELFETALVTKVCWCGWADELRSIRNRVAHARRPHTDDVSRLEQILRNIESGAKVALKSYDDEIDCDVKPGSVAYTWLGESPPWDHIATHARKQYKTRFRV